MNQMKSLAVAMLSTITFIVSFTACSNEDIMPCQTKTTARRKVNVNEGGNNLGDDNVFIQPDWIWIDKSQGPFRISGYIRFEKQEIKDRNKELLSSVKNIRNSCDFTSLITPLPHDVASDIQGTKITLEWKNPQESGIDVDYQFEFHYYDNDTIIYNYHDHDTIRTDTTIKRHQDKWIIVEGTKYFNYSREIE